MFEINHVVKIVLKKEVLAWKSPLLHWQFYATSAATVSCQCPEQPLIFCCLNIAHCKLP